MQFIKSLFCSQGFDNRLRFFTICGAIYTLFIMVASSFADSNILLVILVVLFTYVLSLTTLRRLRDAKLKKNWLLAPNIIFLLIVSIISLSEQYGSYYLLIISALCFAILLTYPSKKSYPFILGYYGPVDMREYQAAPTQTKQANLRIEPRLFNTCLESIDDTNKSTFQTNNTEQRNNTLNQTSFDQQHDIGEIIRLKLLTNKKTLLITAALISFALVTFTVSQFFTYFNEPNSPLSDIHENQQIKSSKRIVLRSHSLAMPDNYTLYLSEHRGVSINWQADEVTETTLWSQKTAQGDRSCKEISFNKGTPIRTLSVQVEPSDDENLNRKTSYFALFSPLDSKDLIQALAFRGNFTLCGYNFSLKGSQAVLERSAQYSQWLDN